MHISLGLALALKVKLNIIEEIILVRMGHGTQFSCYN